MAAVLRLADIGSEPFFDDQAKISMQALELARHSKLEFVGPEMSTGGLRHSPLTNYLYALPFLLSDDPRIAGLFTGMMNVIAVAAIYFIGKQYFHYKTGLVACMLYAIYPAAIKGSRFIWNQNLAAPFVMLYIATALMGYYGNRKYARLAHLPLLSLAGQCHPTLFLLFPISLTCWAHNWRAGRSGRSSRLLQTICSGLLSAITMLPWLYGVISQLGASRSEIDLSTGDGPGSVGMATIIYRLTAGVFSVYGDSLSHSPNPLHDNPNQTLLVAIAIVASGWLLLRIWNTSDWLPGLVILQGFLAVPALILILDIVYWHHHIWPILGSLTLIQATLLGGATPNTHLDPSDRNQPSWNGLLNDTVLRWPSVLVFSAICGHVLYMHVTYDDSEGLHSLDQNIASLEYALDTAEASGRELILLAINDTRPRCPGCPGWEAIHLIKNIPIRVVWDGHALPLPRSGALLMGVNNYFGRPSVFFGGSEIHQWFRIVELPPSRHFQPDLVGHRPVSLSNGTTILGFMRDNSSPEPLPGQPWRIHMIWRVDALASGEYKVFAHLLDSTGSVHAQHDPPGLPAEQWRLGETVMSQLDLTVDDALPATGPLFLRYGMYGDTRNAEPVSKAPKVSQPHSTVQLRGSHTQVHNWSGGLALDLLETNTPILQGTPIELTATWYCTQAQVADTSLHFVLTAGDGTIVHEDYAPLTSEPFLNPIISGVFTTHSYMLRIPTSIDPGNYTLAIEPINRVSASQEPAHETVITVLPRDRQYALPQMDHSLDAVFANQIKLAGYSLDQVGGSLSLVLNWQVLAEIPTDYKYFLHVWRNNEIVDQKDSMPHSYAYPTSWWTPGEVVSDTINLDLDDLGAGETLLTVGLYDPVTGLRLSIKSSAGITLPNSWIQLQPVHLD